MTLFARLQNTIETSLLALVEEGTLPAQLDMGRITVEPPRESAHGDVTTNAAMVLSKQAAMKPRDLAELVGAKLEKLSEVSSVEIAGPGFINLKLAQSFWQARLAEILRAGSAYGDSDMGKGEQVNVEFVSVNPTGPLHVGHGRGAVVGDTLAALLSKAGYAVTREYYINDAGAQIEALLDAFWFRYMVALGKRTRDQFDAAAAAGEITYGGDYLIAPAQALAEADGAAWVDLEAPGLRDKLRTWLLEQMMSLIGDDLAALGVRFDRFTSERALVEKGAVEDVLAYLEARGLIYTGVLEPPKGKQIDDWQARPQTLFKATQFGDDVDRPVRKADGGWTYFAGDMAYHRDKFQRGFRTQINVWGADHGGYVKRMTAALKALSDGTAQLDCKLCQMVNLLDGGKPVKMSKRAGTFTTLREVIEKVGKDVVRFIMLTRKNDAHLDFDLLKATEQSKDNPVFYVQYAHARCRSVKRAAAEMFAIEDLTADRLATAELSLLDDPAELEVIRILAAWPRLVENAAQAHEPHRLAYYLHDLASAFHRLWTKGKDQTTLRFINMDDPALTKARLALLEGVTLVIASGLSVMGVTPVEEMR